MSLTWSRDHHFENREPFLGPSFLLPLPSTAKFINADGINIPQECPILDKDYSARNDETVGEVKPFIVELAHLDSRSCALVIGVE